MENPSEASRIDNNALNIKQTNSIAVVIKKWKDFIIEKWIYIDK